tara:strand:- start:78 stop:398 length:321 start_codon:yes stop_codon:yes gene_type:complete
VVKKLDFFISVCYNIYILKIRMVIKMNPKVKVFLNGRGVSIHRADCKDLTRGENRFYAQDADTFPTVDEALECYLDTGDEQAPGWVMDEMAIFPCTGQTNRAYWQE